MTENTYEAALELAKGGRFMEAESLCNSILEAAPDNFVTRYLLASIKFLTQRYEDCRAECKRLLKLSDTNADVFNMMAAISADYDVDADATEMWLKRALACNPNHAKAITNLASLHLRKQEVEKAESLYQQAYQISGGKDAGALIGLGTTAALRRTLNEALENYREALKYEPNNRQALSSLITTLYSSNNLDEALQVSLEHVYSDHLGQAAIPIFACVKSYCQWDAAEVVLPIMLEATHDKIRDRNLLMQPNLPLLSSHEVTNEMLLKAHLNIAKSIELNRLRPPFQDHPQAFAPGNKIRLAYLSPDLKSHVVSHFFRGLVNHTDRTRFEIHIYSNLSKEAEDEVTEAYKEHAEYFVNVWDMTDIELAERIRNDGIQILVEMSGYTANNRVSALAYRPAPVQISYLGYPCTLGLQEFDYHISDPWLDGPKNAEFFVEKPLRMPQSFLTFGELYEQSINPVPPFERKGHITFGSLNNAYKLNRLTIKLWARILDHVPGSRLFLCHGGYKTQCVQQAILAEFSQYGIVTDRITFAPEKHPEGSHLRYYNEIDIALDAMPLTGGTTTVDSLWMGVPVITKVGDAHAQRMSYSIINNVNPDMHDCIAFSDEEYVAKAIALADNPVRLKALHKDIPLSMENSILRDPRNFTAQMENVLIEAWNRKFPELPIESLLTGSVFTELQVQNTPIVLHDTLRDLPTYVLRELGRWFEPESAFLTRMVTHFHTFFDFSADPGVFAVPIAVAQSQSGGRTYAIRRPGMFSILLGKSIALNALDNLKISVTTPHGSIQPDLVRFSLDWNNGDEGTVQVVLPLIDAASPLILASLRNPVKEDHGAKLLLEAHGYQAYRLLPGYDLLVPVYPDEALQPSDLNLFFCKPQRAEELEAKGMLCREAVGVDELSALDYALWVNHLSACRYAIPYIQDWLEAQPVGQWGEMVRMVLNLDVEARNQALSPGERYGRILMIQHILPLMIQGEPTAPRLMTGIRLMADTGKRALAVAWAEALRDGLAGRNGTLMDEPFLAPLPELEAVAIGTDETEWAYTSALVAIERLRSFSSWYTSAESLEFWKSLRKNPYMAEEAERMTDLLKQRIVQGVRFGVFVDE